MLKKIKKILNMELNMVGHCSEEVCKQTLAGVSSMTLKELENTLKGCNKCFEKNYCNDVVKKTRNYLSAEFYTRNIR